MRAKDLDRARDLLLGCSRPLLVTHVAPDGDAAGSLLGMGGVLQALGKEPTLVCQDPLPRRFSFLPGFETVVDRPAGPSDLRVALDCSDPGRMGEVGTYPGARNAPLLNIDHHVTNMEYGAVNLVDVCAASTTQVLYRLVLHLDVLPDERIATCLLTGLVTDTRGFRTSNVTPDVLRMAIELMEAGASLPAIARNGLDRQPLKTLRFWGAALSRLEMEDGVVWVSLPLALQSAVGHDEWGDTGLTNLLIGVEEAQVAVVLIEREGGQVEVGLRAVPGFDVAGIARALGGGGHALASGCMVPGPLEEAVRRVLRMVQEGLARQRGSADGAGRHPQSG